ncbi:MAG: hypothetical protein ACOYNY_29100 [Caldilineaceae bacterium]
MEQSGLRLSAELVQKVLILAQET